MTTIEIEEIGTKLGVFDDLPISAPPTDGRGSGLIPAGQRNQQLHALAGVMRRHNFPLDAIVAALRVVNAQQCQPPLSDAEVYAIAQSAARYTPAFGQGLPADRLTDAVDVSEAGRELDRVGIKYAVDGIIPAYGMVGMAVAYAKVGKTTLAHALGAAVATAPTFLDRAVRQARVLTLAIEDPPEYTAWLARHLHVGPGVWSFWTEPLRFDEAGLDAVVTTVREGGYGLVLVSSWQAAVVGLVRDENDNAGAVAVVERVKQAARASGVPWLIDAHAGKGEDQSDGADPTKAMRGASGAAGAADYMLSLRYATGTFSTQRRLSGRGRFVSFEPMLLNYDLATGIYTVASDGRSATNESTWALIHESGILTEWASVDAIAGAIGQVNAKGRANTSGRRHIQDALRNRHGVDVSSQTRRGQVTTLYRLSDSATAPHMGVN